MGDYTEYGVQYRACEVLQLHVPTMQVQAHVYIDRPERINTTDGDHCYTCMFLSVYYHATMAKQQLDASTPLEDTW